MAVTPLWAPRRSSRWSMALALCLAGLSAAAGAQPPPGYAYLRERAPKVQAMLEAECTPWPPSTQAARAHCQLVLSDIRDLQMAYQGLPAAQRPEFAAYSVIFLDVNRLGAELGTAPAPSVPDAAAIEDEGRALRLSYIRICLGGVPAAEACERVKSELLDWRRRFSLLPADAQSRVSAINALANQIAEDAPPAPAGVSGGAADSFATAQDGVDRDPFAGMSPSQMTLPQINAFGAFVGAMSGNSGGNGGGIAASASAEGLSCDSEGAAAAVRRIESMSAGAGSQPCSVAAVNVQIIDLQIDYLRRCPAMGQPGEMANLQSQHPSFVAQRRQHCGY